MIKIICQNGFYKFYPEQVAEIRRFVDKYGVDLVQCEDYFTFEVLADLPNYSIKGQLYSGSNPALATYAGTRAEVMAANGYAYNQALKKLVLKSVLNLNKIDYSYANYFIMSSLPQAYFYDNNGIISGFHGWLNVDVMRYLIERFFYE